MLTARESSEREREREREREHAVGFQVPRRKEGMTMSQADSKVSTFLPMTLSLLNCRRERKLNSAASTS